MQTVADKWEGGVKNHWKSVSILYGWSPLILPLLEAWAEIEKNFVRFSRIKDKKILFWDFLNFTMNLKKSMHSSTSGANELSICHLHNVLVFAKLFAYCFTKYSHLSNKREFTLTDFEKKIHPPRLFIS